LGHRMPESKVCQSCGREIEYRKKWARDWENVKFCSDECRRNKNKFDFREAILDALVRTSKPIDPGEVLPTETRFDPLMLEHVRRSARLLADEGRIEILQKGRPVDPQNFRGSIELRLKK
jgi:hypothetical protein